MSNTVRMINLALQTWGIIISLTIILFMVIPGKLQLQSNRFYVTILFSNIGAMGFDMLAYFFRGNTTTLGYYMVRITNFLAFFCSDLLVLFFIFFEKAYLEEKAHQKLSDNILFFSIAGTVTEFILLIMNSLHPFIYRFDENNRYSRMDGYIAIHVFTFLALFISLVILIRQRKYLKRSEIISFLFYIFVPLVTMIMSVYSYGIVFAQVGTTTATIVLYVFFQTENERRAAEEREELMQNRVAIMMSQIQPHFIFNALNSIEYLCNIGSPDAGKAVNHFARYLRGNMDSLSDTGAVPFQQELSHLKSYLYIEQLRFPHITVTYHFECTDFFLPPLTLQPLVENSIKHGLRKRKSDARVIISTKESNDFYYILVEDNGIGFDPDSRMQEDPEHPHIGLKNIRERLKLVCEGSLEIRSIPNEKTVVTIKIPR